MQESYILTTMFFADDFCTQVKAADGHLFPYSNSEVFSPTLYLQPLLYEKQNGLDPSETDAASNCRQAMIDLGQEYVVDWLDWWPNHEKTDRVPQTWQVEVSLDGKNYFQVFAIDQLDYLWGTALLIDMPCATRLGHVVSFTPVKARFVRFYFDNATRKNFSDEWAIELRLSSIENHPPKDAFNFLSNFEQQFTILAQ